MNIYNTLKAHIISLIEQNISIFDEQITSSAKHWDSNHLEKMSFEPPKNKKHGDISTNISMILASQYGSKPIIYAEKIIKILTPNEFIESISFAPPGFLNLTLSKSTLYSVIKDILNHNQSYGFSDVGKGEKINIEYASINPTGPMHIGHSRSAIYGDVLSNLLTKNNYDITREYYINNAGNQMEVVAKSLFIRYLQLMDPENNELTIAEGLYPGEYMIDIAKELEKIYQCSLLDLEEEERNGILKKFAEEHIMSLIKGDLQSIGVHHDVFFSEKSLYESHEIEAAIEHLREQGLIYKGILEAPKGKVIDDWEAKEQLIFKSTQFNDDVDRTLQKSDGKWTYFAPDIAYHYNKFNRGFKKMITILGADHNGYIKRLQSAVSAISNQQAVIDIKICQLVKFIKNNETVKMSKRSGEYIEVSDILQDLNKDVLRFMMLTKKNDVPIDLDINLLKSQSKDNLIFYIQYAYARCHSIIRNAKEQLNLSIEEFHNNFELLSNLNHELDLEIIKKLMSYPRIIQMSVIHLEPHRIANYLQDLAATFHNIWHQGAKDQEVKFIQPLHIEKTKAKLLLIQSMIYIIESAFSIFAITPTETM